MLTEQEKVAGRKFRDEITEWLSEQVMVLKPHYVVPTYLAYYRHLCPALGDKSVSLALAEQYVLSPESRVAFVYRKGKCPKCRRLAMSDKGRIVDALERPPMGRVVHWRAAG